MRTWGGDTPGTIPMQAGAAATGDGTAMVCTSPTMGGYAVAAIQLSGTFTATVTFEGTVDGSNWIAMLFENITTGASATTASATGIYRATVLGLLQVRARVSAYTNGNVTATGLMVA